MANFWENDPVVGQTAKPEEEEEEKKFWEQDEVVQQAEPVEEAVTQTRDYTGLNFDNILEDKELLQTIRDYYGERDEADFSELDDLSVAKEFVYDRMLKDQNLAFGAAPELNYVLQDASPEQKRRLAELRAAWAAMPAFWEEGGRGFIGLAENIVTAMEDPVTLFTGGMGGLVAKGLASKGVGALGQTVAGMATTGSLEGAANLDIEMAQQEVEQEIGVRDELDYEAGALAYLIGAAAPAALAGAVSGARGIRNRLRARSAAVEQLEETLPTWTVDDVAGFESALVKDGKVDVGDVRLVSPKTEAKTTRQGKGKVEVGDGKNTVPINKEAKGWAARPSWSTETEMFNTQKEAVSFAKKAVEERSAKSNVEVYKGDQLVGKASSVQDAMQFVPGKKKAEDAGPTIEDEYTSRFKETFARESSWQEKSMDALRTLSDGSLWIQKLFDANASLRKGKLGAILGDYWDNEVYRNFRMYRALPQQVMIMLEGGRFNFKNLDAMKAREAKGDAFKFEDFEFLDGDNRQSLVEVFQPLQEAEGDVSGFLSYVAAKRMKELKQRDSIQFEYPAGVDDDMLDAVIRKGESNETYAAVAKSYDEYNSNLIDMLQATGVLDADGAARIRGANAGWYVPFYRLSEDLDEFGIKSKRATGVGESGLKKIYGGEGQIDDLLTNVIKNTESLVTAAVLNGTKRSLYDRLEQMPKEISEQFAKKVPPKMVAKYIDPAEVKARLEKAGMDVSEFDDAMGEDAMIFWSRMGKPKGNIDVVMRDGKAEYWEIQDPMLLDTVSTLNSTLNMGSIVNAWAKAKRMFTQLVTHEPTFVFRNAIRDTVTAAVLTKHRSAKTATPVSNVLTSMLMELRSDPRYADFMVNGGGFSSIRANEVGLDDMKVREWYVRRNIDPDSVLWNSNKLHTALKKAWRGYDRLLSGAENAARFSEYRQGLETGASKREAAFAGRDVSTDFGMRGSAKTMQFLTSVAPFFNPGLQGLYHTGRRFAQDPVGVGAMATAFLAVPSLMLASMNEEYDIVQNQPDYIKDTHWIIPLSEEDIPFPDPELADRVWLIPKPYDVGALFATIPERIMQAAKDKEGLDATEEFMYHFYRVLTDQMMLSPTPYGTDLLLNQAMNTKFGGSPIVPKRMEDVKSTFQYDPDTNVIAREVAQAINQSPKRVEQMIADLFGSGGTLILDSMDYVAREVTDEPELASPDWLPFPVSEMPVIKAFYRMEPMPTADETSFYNLLSRAAVPAKTLEYMKKEGRADDIEELLESIPGMTSYMAGSKALQQNVKTFGQINRYLRSVQGSDKLSDVEKLDKIKEMKKEYREAVKGIVATLKEDPVLENYMRESNLYTFLFNR